MLPNDFRTVEAVRIIHNIAPWCSVVHRARRSPSFGIHSQIVKAPAPFVNGIMTPPTERSGASVMSRGDTDDGN